MTGPLERAGLYGRTVVHLRPAQLAHRVRLRAQQEALRRWPDRFEQRWTPPARPPAGVPSAFLAVDASAPPACGTFTDLAEGRFRFLDEEVALGDPPAWDPPDASQLWLYHHHYWEWAWTLAAHPDRDAARRVFARQLTSWLEATRFGRWNAWAPYPTSLRAWVFVNVYEDLALGGPADQPLLAEIRRHAGFVRHNLELDVGGNHLIKNLKALVGLGVFLGDDDLTSLATQHLVAQLPIQVLPDGGHFELSPSYHGQVLGDLVDIAELLAAARAPAVPGLDDAITRMRRWLGLMLLPDGDVAVFNDGERLGRTRLAALRPGPPAAEPLTVLADSGYVVIRPNDRLHLVVDVGAPCPADLPAHAQADCLGFELSIDGQRVVVDPGTSVYGSGPQRAWERSTRAHSTIEVDGIDQTEVWGAFRAGRLARATLERAEVAADGVIVSASHDGYRHLPGAPVHRRRWTASGSVVQIDDEVVGDGVHDLRHHLLVCGTATVAEETHTSDTITVTGPTDATQTWVDARYATGFGQFHPARSLVTTALSPLPATFTTRIEAAPLPGGASGPVDPPM